METSKVLKIANYYKIPVTTWGGGGGTQGGAIPVAGGIVLDPFGRKGANANDFFPFADIVLARKQRFICVLRTIVQKLHQ